MRRRVGAGQGNWCLLRLRELEAELAAVAGARPGWDAASSSLWRVRSFIAESVPWEQPTWLEERAVQHLEARLAMLRESLVVEEAERVVGGPQ